MQFMFNILSWRESGFNKRIARVGLARMRIKGSFTLIVWIQFKDVYKKVEATVGYCGAANDLEERTNLVNSDCFTGKLKGFL